ncbi:capsid protein [Ensifer adhaerens]|nr:capsid protein [Ensifer adhaerens]
MSGKRPFPIDATLTAIAIGYRNPAHTLIGRRVLPAVPVLSEQFKWSEFPLDEGFSVPELRVGRKGRVNQVEFSVTERDASVDDFGLDDALPQSDIDAAARARAEKRSTYDPRGAAVEGLTNLIELGREVRAAALVQNPANYAADKSIVLSGASQFSDPNSDPYGVIDQALDSTLVYRPNTISMGQAAWSKIKKHPRLIKAVKGGLTDEGAITRAQFAELFELKPENILVGEALLNTSRKGQSPTLSRVWGKSIQLTYIDPSKQRSDDYNVTWGFTAELGSRISGSIVDGDIGLQGGERIRVGERVKELVVAKDVGFQIRNAVA